MTLAELLKECLVERGMFLQDADVVFVTASKIIEEGSPNYRFTWDADYIQYPASLRKMIITVMMGEALKWIDENCPKAWYREAFVI